MFFCVIRSLQQPLGNALIRIELAVAFDFPSAYNNTALFPLRQRKIRPPEANLMSGGSKT